MRLAIICVLLLAVFSAAPFLYSQAPQLINYQGQLKQNDEPASGTFSITFRIYSSATGGTALWTETQTVTVNDGVFNVLLGSVTPFPNNLFAQSGTRYLGVQVAGGSEMTPRFRFTSVAYALNAATVDAVDTDKIVPNIVSSIDGVSNDGGDIDLVAGSNVTITPDDVNNRITISATSSNGVGDDLGNHTATQNLTLNGNWLSGDGGNEGLQVSTAGNVGIGTATPGFPLSFPNTLGDKISLWGQTGAHYGLGIQSSLLQIHTALSVEDIAFGYGSSAAFTEIMRVKGNGNVGIGTTSPEQRLDIRSTAGYCMARVVSNDGSKAQMTAYNSGELLLNSYTTGGFSPGSIRICPGDVIDSRSVYITSTGNVGIGTATPTQKLTVAGTIESTSGGFKFPDGTIQTTADTGGGGNGDNLGNHTATQNINLNGHWLSGDGENEGIFVDGAGNVGIGITGPSLTEKLRVSGGALVDRIKFTDGSEQATAFQLPINKSYSGSDYAFQIEHFGSSGEVCLFSIKNSTNNSRVIDARSDGIGGVARFTLANTSTNATAVDVQNHGTGTAGWFVNRSTSNAQPALIAETDTPGGEAARFEGDVLVLGELTKSSGAFLIDHPLDPENKILQHSFVESPEMMNIYKGRARLNNSEAVIGLPNYFDALNHPEGREISLTPVNGWSPLYLEGEINNNQFVVKTTKDGNPEQEFSWVVYAVRNDAYAKDHPIVVEEEKGVNNGFKKGELLYSPGANNN